MNLSHPAVLVFHFIRIYWMYGTLVSLHQYFMDSSTAIWYLKESVDSKPLKRCIKRTRKRLGAAAIDGLLLPI